MSFNLVKKNSSISITIDTLTPQMISHLITFYAYDIEARDVWMNNNIYGRTGIIMDYPRIHEDVVKQFYEQLDLLTHTVRDVVLGKYHTGSVVLVQNPEDGSWHYPDGNEGEPTQEEIDAWQWGETPQTIEDLKYWVYYLVKRDYYENTSWLYEYSEGHFEMIKPFIEFCIDMMLEMTDDVNGDYSVFVQSIKENY